MGRTGKGRWRFSEEYGDITSSPKGVLRGSERICICSNNLMSKNVVRDNAEFIVKADKYFDEVVERLKKV